MDKKQFPNKKFKKGTLIRLLKLLFGLYPKSWIAIFACLIILVIANAAASIFLQQTTIIIEEGLIYGYDAIKTSLYVLLLVMIIIRLSSVVATCVQKLLMANC